MNAEQVYERIVTGLEDRYMAAFERVGRDGLAQAAREGQGQDRDYRRECAVDAIEKFMFEDVAFELVKATDVSDIACEVGDRIEREDWTG